MEKRYWLRGGTIGALAFLVAFILLWIFSSINMNCLLEPIQSINVGGPSCHFKNYFSIWSLSYFIAPTILGLLLGIFGGVFYGKIDHTNIKPIKLSIIIIIILILIFLWRSLL